MICRFCHKEHVVNIPLLNKVLDQIRDDPSSWDQQSWRTVTFLEKEYLPDTDEIRVTNYAAPNCGTAFCVAGHAAVMAGWEFINDSYVVPPDTPKNERRVNSQLVQQVAMCELGLDGYWTAALFNGTNTWENVKRISAQIIAEAEAKL